MHMNQTACDICNEPFKGPPLTLDEVENAKEHLGDDLMVLCDDCLAASQVPRQ